MNLHLSSAIRPVLFALLVLSISGEVSAQIQWRISVKFILGSSGQFPTNADGFTTAGVNLTNHQAVTDNIAFANELLDRTGRGFRFNLTEIQDVSGATSFFNLPARSEANKVSLEASPR